MLRTLIVDDEPDARDNLRLLLEEHCPEVEVAGLAGNAPDARAMIDRLDVQALFLDIKMPGEDGFDLLRSLNGRELGVVFTTAHDGFALRAFKENAVDYLEKPVDVDLLKRAVGKLCRLAAGAGLAGQRHGAIGALMNDPTLPMSTRIAVPGRDGLMLHRYDEILYLEGNDSYTTIHFTDGRHSLSSRHIRLFESGLDPRRFFRIHKSYIINLQHLVGFNRAEGNMALMSGGKMLPVGRRRIPEFLAMIHSY